MNCRNYVFFAVFACYLSGSICLDKTATAAGDLPTKTSKLAFVANIDGNWDLFIAEPDGSHLVQLTDTPYDENEPRWCSDKLRIAYSASDGSINIVDVATKETYRVPTGDSRSPITSPSFSPNCDDIAIVRTSSKTADATEVATFSFADKTFSPLVSQHTPQYFPSWSPVSDHIVYANVHCSAECGRIIQELWLAGARSGKSEQIMLTNSLCMQPVWSPDGERVSFSSDMSGNFDIWEVQLKSRTQKQLTTDPHSDTRPAWSPDGRRIAFVSTRTGKMKIWIKYLENGDLTLFSPFPNQDVECRDVAW